LTIYGFTIALMVSIWLAIVILNEKVRLLSSDHFRSAAARYFAYAWLGLFLVLLGVLVAGAAQNPARAKDLARAPFYALFGLHAILIIFLLGWWVAVGMPSLIEFFNIQRGRSGEAIMIGLAVGVGGWIFTIGVAVMIALILRAIGFLPEDAQPSPMVGFLAALAWWKKIAIIASAMTVEEAFFRAWLQKRIGLIASTTLFALAHFTLGQPLLLIGVSVISLVIGFTFYRTKNVLPGVVAHGVFDAIQLFVIIPIVFKMMGV
jgi:membrane protease YdiL (CAAX protease family)